MKKLTRFKLALLAYVLFDFLIGGHCGGFFSLDSVAAAQSGPPAIGNITSAGSTCSTTSVPTNCVILQLDAATGAATIDISGTWAATLQFEGFTGVTWTNINCTPPNSTTAVSSSTANGAWQCNVAAFSAIRVRGSAYTSGTAVVYINSAHASAKSGGSPFSSGGLTANLIPKSDGAGKLINSLASDSGTVLTYNSLVVPDYASGGVTAGQVPVSNGSSNLFDSSINDGRNGVVTIPGQVTHQGTLTISQLATPANATLVVTGGVGTNYTYKLVAKAGSVGTAVNSGVSTAAGPTTLDGTHFIDINFTSQNGCTSIDVYRTVGGATQGKIGNVACTTVGSAMTLRDNALVGDASTAPVANTTGGITSASVTEIPGTSLGSSVLILPPATSSATVVGGIGTASNGSGINFQSTQIQFLQSAQRAAALQANGATGGFTLASSWPISWSNTSADALGSSADTFIRKRSAANIAFGITDVNGTPVDQTLSVQNAITGSDLPGGHFTIDAPLGTGLGAGAKTCLNRALMKATGTTAQTATNGFCVGESKTLSNTSATAQVLANISVPSNSAGGVEGTINVNCTDGTNFDSETQSFNTSFVNKAGTVTVTAPVITATSAANNSGSCTAGITAVANGNGVDIKVTPVFGTIVPTTTTGTVMKLTVMAGGNVTIN